MGSVINIDIDKKAYLTIDEASEYFNIGKNKLRAISDDEHCEFVLWVGAKRLINRKKLEKYLEQQYSI